TISIARLLVRQRLLVATPAQLVDPANDLRDEAPQLSHGQERRESRTGSERRRRSAHLARRTTEMTGSYLRRSNAARPGPNAAAALGWRRKTSFILLEYALG